MQEKNRTASELKAQYRSDDSNYEVLRGDKQKVKERANQWSSDIVRQKYVNETDQLIGILDGSITDTDAIDMFDPEKGEVESFAPDTVLWLDKSARPVSWLVDAFWEQMADPNAQKPEYEFLNIDRVNWFVFAGHDEGAAESRLGPEDFNIEDIHSDKIDGLRALFVQGDLTEENWRDEVWRMPTRLDGKNILIVDEVRNRGGTLAIAMQIMKKAIPEATFNATYFWHTGRYSMNKTSAEPKDQQMESAPVWYDKHNEMGRGVGDISIDYWEQLYEHEPTQDNLKQRLGAFALSAPHHNPSTYAPKEDTLAKKIQQDFAHLSYDVARGNVIRRPSRLRDYDEILAIYAKQGMSPQEMKTYNSSL